MPHNLHNTLQPMKGGKFYSLPQLGKALNVKIDRLPVSIRIVLESVLRNCDGKKVTEEHVKQLASWKPTAERTVRNVQEAARAKGVQLPILNAGGEGEFATAFASLIQLHGEGILVAADPVFGQTEPVVRRRVDVPDPACPYGGQGVGGVALGGRDGQVPDRRAAEPDLGEGHPATRHVPAGQGTHQTARGGRHLPSHPPSTGRMAPFT